MSLRRNFVSDSTYHCHPVFLKGALFGPAQIPMICAIRGSKEMAFDNNHESHKSYEFELD